MSRFAKGISDHELGDYQRAVRTVLRYALITSTWPDTKALPRIRRYSATLRQDLADAFGYRLELHGATARLVRAKDTIDPTQPARARSRTQAGPGRPFDRRRYAYLMLCLAVLGRAGIQITLSELADAVAADANRVPGLGLDPDVSHDRRAFVDAVGWLEERGALTLADGSATAWASGVGEALYDVARDVLFALYRPTRMVQAVPSVRSLLHQAVARSGNEERRLAAQAARRAVVEQPVVYFRDVPEGVANHLRGPALAEDLRRLTGLRVERRAEGVLLVDTANFSIERFPGTGAVAQAAVLLAVEMADRIIDPDARRVRRVDAVSPAVAQDELIALVDAGLPQASRLSLPGLDPSAGEDDAPEEVGESVPGERTPTATPESQAGADGQAGAEGQAKVGGEAMTEHEPDAPRSAPMSTEDGRLPFISDSFLRTAVAGILDRHGSAFGEGWHADPERLRTEAVALLARFGCVRPVPGGVLVLPLVGRYRNTVATTREPTRRVGQQGELF